MESPRPPWNKVPSLPRFYASENVRPQLDHVPDSPFSHLDNPPVDLKERRSALRPANKVDQVAPPIPIPEPATPISLTLSGHGKSKVVPTTTDALSKAPSIHKHTLIDCGIDPDRRIHANGMHKPAICEANPAESHSADVPKKLTSTTATTTGNAKTETEDLPRAQKLPAVLELDEYIAEFIQPSREESTPPLVPPRSAATESAAWQCPSELALMQPDPVKPDPVKPASVYPRLGVSVPRLTHQSESAQTKTPATDKTKISQPAKIKPLHPTDKKTKTSAPVNVRTSLAVQIEKPDPTTRRRPAPSIPKVRGQSSSTNSRSPIDRQSIWASAIRSPPTRWLVGTTLGYLLVPSLVIFVILKYLIPYVFATTLESLASLADSVILSTTSTLARASSTAIDGLPTIATPSLSALLLSLSSLLFNSTTLPSQDTPKPLPYISSAAPVLLPHQANQLLALEHLHHSTALALLHSPGSSGLHRTSLNMPTTADLASIQANISLFNNNLITELRTENRNLSRLHGRFGAFLDSSSSPTRLWSDWWRPWRKRETSKGKLLSLLAKSEQEVLAGQTWRSGLRTGLDKTKTMTRLIKQASRFEGGVREAWGELARLDPPPDSIDDGAAFGGRVAAAAVCASDIEGDDDGDASTESRQKAERCSLAEYRRAVTSTLAWNQYMATLLRDGYDRVWPFVERLQQDEEWLEQEVGVVVTLVRSELSERHGSGKEDKEVDEEVTRAAETVKGWLEKWRDRNEWYNR